MKKNKKKILIVSIIILAILLCVGILTFYKSRQNNKENNNTSNEISQNVIQDYLNTKNNSVMYKNEASLEDLKKEYKITGEDDLYCVETESDGRKVINVKPNINYKVAFSGMINGKSPNIQEIDKTYETQAPTENGIWINTNDREKIVNYLNSNNELKAKYEINQEGYLKATQTDKLSKEDEVIKKIIDGNKQYILSISSKYYMVDVVNGKIVVNRYNDLEEYQTYEYIQYENKIIIFISENLENKLTSNEIFDSIIELVNQL